MVASFFEVAMFMWSGTRQVSRLRQRFLEASLKQEQAYYDVHATSGDVLSGLNEDCNAVQAAIRCVVCSCPGACSIVQLHPACDVLWRHGSFVQIPQRF